MASTGIANGTDIALYRYVAGTAVKVANLTSNSFSRSTAMRDSSNKDTGGYETSLPGRKSWTVSADGFFSEDNNGVDSEIFGFNDLEDDWRNDRELLIMYGSQVSGDIFYKGKVYIESLENTDPDMENSTFSITLRGTGSLSRFTWSY